jgi:hypothetical protein
MSNPYSAPNSKTSASPVKARSRLLVKLAGALAGLLFGVVASPFLAGAYVSATYSCQPGPGEPCDAGAYVGIGLALLLAPLLGLVFGAVGYWLAARHERRRAA